MLILNSSTSKEIIKLLKETLKKVPAEVLAFRLNKINKLSSSYETCKLKATYIQAREDRLVPEKSVDVFYSLFTDLNVIKINGSHFCIQSNPEAYAEIIQNEVLALSTKIS